MTLWQFALTMLACFILCAMLGLWANKEETKQQKKTLRLTIPEYPVKPWQLREARETIRRLDGPLALVLDTLFPLEPCDHDFRKAMQRSTGMYDRPGSICIGCGVLGQYTGGVSNSWIPMDVYLARQKRFREVLHANRLQANSQ